uniref:Uncharacterized protein n=1 Tax=Aegilops tauschii subsp. strangulata TaxID=200361 RepID=A0A453MCB4_AEGTS
MCCKTFLNPPPTRPAEKPQTNRSGYHPKTLITRQSTPAAIHTFHPRPRFISLHPFPFPSTAPPSSLPHFQIQNPNLRPL